MKLLKTISPMKKIKIQAIKAFGETAIDEIEFVNMKMARKIWEEFI